MSLSSPGIGSGLDVPTIVAALVKAEIAGPQAQQDKRLANVNSEISALGQVKSSLASLQTSLSSLRDLTKLYTMKATVSDENYATVTTSTGATAGSYNLNIIDLAQRQTLASGYLSTTNVGSGQINIRVGTYTDGVFAANSDTPPITINLTGTNSLVAVKDAINNSGSGVTASIVSDSGGSRLTLTSKQTGLNHAINISSDISALNYDGSATVGHLEEKVAAKDSKIELNGIELINHTNELKDTLSGMTINLKKQTSSPISISVAKDTDQLSNTIKEFVKKYNESMTVLNNLSGYNPDTKVAGEFQGDAQFRNIKTSLSRLVSNPPFSNPTGSIQSLGDLGIYVNKKGLLEIKEADLKDAIANNYENIGPLFAKTSNDGIAVQLNSFLENYVSTTGQLSSRSSRLNDTVRDLSNNQLKIDARSTSIESRYLKQFYALDSLLVQMQSTSSFLTQQLSSLPTIKSK